ncbi:MAG TPA: hypothetical protein VIY47_10440 [Ignavibacteriaceae bacterium]
MSQNEFVFLSDDEMREVTHDVSRELRPDMGHGFDWVVLLVFIVAAVPLFLCVMVFYVFGLLSVLFIGLFSYSYSQNNVASQQEVI